MADSTTVTLTLKLDSDQWNKGAAEATRTLGDIGKGAEDAGRRASDGIGRLGPILEQIAKDISGLRSVAESGFGSLAKESSRAAAASSAMAAATREGSRTQAEHARTAQDVAASMRARGSATAEAAEGSRRLGIADGVAIEMGRQLLNVVTQMAVAFPRLVAQQVEYASSVGETAQRLGVSTEALSSMASLARRTGSDMGAVSSAMETLGAKTTEFMTGIGRGAKMAGAAFAALDVSVKAADGSMRPLGDIMVDVARALDKIPNGAFKSKIANDLLGSSAAQLDDTLQVLARDGMGGVIDSARDMGAVVSATAAVQAKQLQNGLRDLREHVLALANDVATQGVPVLLAFAGAMTDTGAAASGAGAGSSALAGVFEILGRAAVLVTEFLRNVGVVMLAMIDTASELRGALVNTIKGAVNAVQGLGELKAGNISAGLESMRAASAAATTGIAGNMEGIRTAFGAVGQSLAESSAKLEAYQSRIDANAKAQESAARAAQMVADTAKRNAAAVAGTQFANVVAGSSSADVGSGAATSSAMEAYKAYLAALKDGGGTIKQAKDDGDALVKSLQDQAATFGMSRDEIDRYKVSMSDMSPAQRQSAFDAIDLRAAQEEIARATNEEADALERLRGIAASEADRVQGMRDKLSGATAAQIAYNKAIRDAQAAYKAAGGASSAAAVKALADATEKAKKALSLGDQADEAERFANIMASLGDDIDVDPITKKMHEIEEAIKSMADPKHIDALQDALDRLNVKKAGATLERSASAVAQGLTSMQKLAGEGTEAYARMQVAIDAANIAAAIGAIVNQGMGDPYTAFARIAAMAALMAQFVGDVGAASAAGFDSGRAERQQARQGTGTVLGDASAKSESIAHAVEITANATQQLVGINRGMLRALQSLQQALGAAGVSLARGAANADFPALQDNVGALFGTSDSFDHAINSFLFGGSQEVIDQGIIIAGGALQDMIDQMAIGAYQTVEEDGGLFGSDSTWDAMSGVSEAFGRQFQLVIGSIVDAVREGATALGMLPADIEAAIAQYRVEEIRISLKGLSAEDQQKELEAVFSSIFDGLAGAVVPFIEQFQQVGEGLGETLVRVATEVQITQEAFKQLGMVVNETDPERFAQIADGLVTAAGGIDDFISGLQQFVSSFASDAQQFRVAQDALTSAFSQYGLALPATRDGMYALMQSLDATTEAGREQIATLLRLAQTADSYYSLLDKAQSDAIKQIEDAIDTLSEFGVGVGEGGNKLRAISKSAIDAVKAANLLAQAAGQQGAAEWQLALIHRVAATRAAEAIAQLMSATAEMVSNFYSGNYAGDADSASSAVRGFGDAMADAAQQASDAIRLLLGDLSPLNDQAKLQVALQALSRGEVGREDVLQIGRRLYASSQAYTDLFNRVMAMAVPTIGGSDSASVGADALAGATKSPEQIARERMDLAMQIAQNVATLSNAQGETFDSIAGMLHLNLADIADAMGLTNDDLTSYLENLVDQENRTPDSVKEGADRIIAALYDIANGGTGPDAVFEDRSHLYDVPEPKVLQIAGPTPEAAQNTEALNRVGDMLGELLVAVRTGNGEIAQAVDGVADATRDVRRSVDNGNDAAQAGLGRNLRVIV